MLTNGETMQNCLDGFAGSCSFSTFELLGKLKYTYT